MIQREPVREVQVSRSLRVYVSDAACVVIEQSFGEVAQVFFDDNEVEAIIAALRALKTSAAAKRSALEVTQQAEYRIAFGEDPHDL